jgi:hypothetical protein
VDVSPQVAGRLGRELVELPLPSFHGYAFDGTKARDSLRFEAHYAVSDMLDEAYATRIA